MIYTTLNKIRKCEPCSDGWAKLRRYLGKTQAADEPLALGTILKSNGLDDALWCLRAVDGHQREMRLYAVWCVRQVQHLITDPRSLAALDIAERHANGDATDEELSAAWDAAWDAAWATASDAACDAAWATAWATASDAARATASDAAWDAAWATAWATASDAARATASDAAWDAAWATAWDAAWDARAAEFRRVFCGGEENDDT